MTKWTFMAAAASLALAGCNSNKAATNAANQTGPAPATAAAPAPPAAVSAEYQDLGGQAEALVGRWTAIGDCARALELRADGTFANTDGQSGRWSSRAEGDELLLAMADAAGSESGLVGGVTETSFTMLDVGGGQQVAMSRCP